MGRRRELSGFCDWVGIAAGPWAFLLVLVGKGKEGSAACLCERRGKPRRALLLTNKAYSFESL